jgi:hypothetical protein
LIKRKKISILTDLKEKEEKLKMIGNRSKQDMSNIVVDDMKLFTNITGNIDFFFVLSGLLANMACIYGYCHKAMRNHRYNWYLLSIAIFEFIFCVIQAVDNLYLHELNNYTNAIFDFLIHFIDSFVIIVILILSVDRLCAVNNPLKVRNSLTYKYATQIISVTFISLIFIKIPNIGLCYIKSENNYNLLYCLIISPLLFNIIPIISILFVSSVLIFERISYYRILSKERSALNHSIQRRAKLTNSKFNKSLEKENVLILNIRLNGPQSQPLSGQEKSQHFITLFLALWLVLTTLPYYLTNLTLLSKSLILDYSSFNEISKKQIIYSILFNSNHCIIHFLIYIFFNFEFRNLVFKPLKNIYFHYFLRNVVNL